MAAFVSQLAPDFKADAYVNGGFKEVSLSQFKGKKVVLFFYPLDFTFVCPTEILAFADTLDEFKKRNTEVIGVSVDSKFTHHAWANTPRADGGIQGVNYPLLSDLNKQIARDYGVLMEGPGIALRGLFIIKRMESSSILRSTTWTLAAASRKYFDCWTPWTTPRNMGRSARELKKGSKAMKPTGEGLKEYVRA